MFIKRKIRKRLKELLKAREEVVNSITHKMPIQQKANLYAKEGQIQFGIYELQKYL